MKRKLFFPILINASCTYIYCDYSKEGMNTLETVKYNYLAVFFFVVNYCSFRFLNINPSNSIEKQVNISAIKW